MKDLSGKSVLVTGASSGIGNAVALQLATQGYTVLATVRRAPDAEKLTSLGLYNLRPLYPLDLTSPSQIQAMTHTITTRIKNNECPPLYAIINIAGAGGIAPIELMDISGFREELEKRLVGPLLLLQRLLPLLRQTRGRVLWIATPGLLPVPYVAGIHAPDFAVNYLARTLNLELLPDGIRNTLIRCGGIDTPSPKKTEHQIADRLKNRTGIEIYKDRLDKTEKQLERFAAKRTAPEKVAMLTLRILSAKRPKVRYQIGHMSKMGAFIEKLPQAWTDYLMEKRERHTG